jgi:uncharacterized protein (TIGR03790 family)
MVLLVLFSPLALAGGSPLRTLVVVNQNSDRSLELGRYYAEQRGIPDHHLFAIDTYVSNSVELAVYSNQIEGPIRAYLTDTGLSNQIDRVVFSMDIPYRVYLPPMASNRWAGLTATFFYGFYSSPNAFVFGCDLAAGTDHDYFASERGFDRRDVLVDHRYYLASMLTATNLALTKRLVDRSVRADHTRPPGSVLLMRTTDTRRNVQWPEFENTLLLGRAIDAPVTNQWLDTDSVTGYTNIIGVTAGRTAHAWLSANTTLPGAFGEHLTSFGGFLFENSGGQMVILDWIRNGYSGSHGTVVEPCAYTNKFTSPRFHYWYGRGFSLGESLYMGVQNPYQGIFVGDLLCEPYAQPPQVTWIGLTNRTVLSGTTAITGVVVAASVDHPVGSLSWWRGGRWQADLPGAVPAPGAVVETIINGNNRSYTVQDGDSLYDVVEGLADAINAMPPLGVTAAATGDRLEIRQNSLGVDASGWTLTGTVDPGTATVAAVHLVIPTNGFLETTVAAREQILLRGNAVTGDVVRTVISNLSGVVATTDVVVATDVSNNFSHIQQLVSAINSNVALQSSDGCYAKYAIPVLNGSKTNAEAWLFARTNSWEGHNLEVTFEVLRLTNSTLGLSDGFTDQFNDNADNLSARATVFLAAGVTQMHGVVNLDTTNWPDGPHELTLVARDGTGVETEGRAKVTVVVDNHDVSCVITSPIDRIYRLKTGVLTVDVTTAVSMGTVTQVVVYAEGKLVSTGTTAEVDLAAYGAGPLHLQAQAWDDLGRSTLSEIVTVRLFTDADADGMSDQWEYEHFGAFTNASGLADVDGDGVSNYDEFIADTQPTNASSYLSIAAIEEGVSIAFPSSTNRWYQLRFNDGDLLNGASWLPTGIVFRGNGAVTNFSDAAPPANRFYAIEPSLPQ